MEAAASNEAAFNTNPPLAAMLALTLIFLAYTLTLLALKALSKVAVSNPER